ncbi:MAG: hypothetical protein HQK83_17750 [Fibrobacteria bacterium]|nr:hypothetical protein [Fibrobacteria bacterium]
MKPRIEDKRRVKLTEILSDNYIPFMEGRPERRTMISKHDILDLKILLHTVKDVNHFVMSL